MKKLTKIVPCLFALLTLLIVFSVLSIISPTLPYWLYHQLVFLYVICSKSSTCCPSEWAAVYMQEILFTLQRFKMFLHHQDLSHLQCLSLFMNQMFSQNKTPAALSYSLTPMLYFLEYMNRQPISTSIVAISKSSISFDKFLSPRWQYHVNPWNFSCTLCYMNVWQMNIYITHTAMLLGWQRHSYDMQYLRGASPPLQ